MPSLSSTIKTAIKAVLDTLVPATLGSVIQDDFRIDILSRNIMKFPCAILTTPSVASVRETNRDNLRSYTYDVVVVMKGEDINDATDVEEVMDAVLNAFDNAPTLSGAAVGEVEPAASTPEAITTGDKTYVVFVVTLACKTIYVHS